jgi:hypothetical protein
MVAEFPGQSGKKNFKNSGNLNKNIPAPSQTQVITAA